MEASSLKTHRYLYSVKDGYKTLKKVGFCSNLHPFYTPRRKNTLLVFVFQYFTKIVLFPFRAQAKRSILPKWEGAFLVSVEKSIMTNDCVSRSIRWFPPRVDKMAPPLSSFGMIRYKNPRCRKTCNGDRGVGVTIICGNCNTFAEN